jgi:hypothetical protein
VLSLGFDCALAFEASEETVAERFFPHLSQWRFFQAPITHFSRKLGNFEVFKSVSNLVFIVL